jgi:Rrf2 family transcriptional regulator, nitric oxide-sensitive transcriptional repressor
MKLNTKTDYCLRVLIYLLQNNKKVRIQEIADKHEISKNHLSIAVNKLSELNYIKTSPGPKGGIEINEDAKNNNIGELVTKIESFVIAECFDKINNTCQLDPKCKLKHMLNKATLSFIEELSRYKIKDLV